MSSNVLIVEDDPTLRMALRDTLEGAEFKVFEAVNGKEGLLQLMHEDIDVVVSDVQMDVMDGNQLLRTTREKYPAIVDSSKKRSTLKRVKVIVHDIVPILTPINNI